MNGSLTLNQLGIRPNTSTFENAVAYRIGRPSASKPRDILAKYRKVSDRNDIYRKRTAMKGTYIYVNEDLCPGTVAARQAQMHQYHEARKAGKQVYWSYRKLVVRDSSPHHSQQHHDAPKRPTITTTTNSSTTNTSTATSSSDANPITTHSSPELSVPLMSMHEYPNLTQHPAMTQETSRPDDTQPDDTTQRPSQPNNQQPATTQEETRPHIPQELRQTGPAAEPELETNKRALRSGKH